MRQVESIGKSLLKCPVCSTFFWRYNAHIRNETHCCSNVCSQQVRKRPKQTIINLTCQTCGKEFEKRKGQERNVMYCSRACIQKPSGKNHVNWKGGNSDRSYASKKAIEYKIKIIGRCQSCGDTRKLQGHHIKEYTNHPEFRNSLDNIKVLCKYCHSIEHPKLKRFILSSNQ